MNLCSQYGALGPTTTNEFLLKEVGQGIAPHRE